MIKTQNINSIFKDLLKNIQEKQDVKIISENFAKIKSNPERIDFVYKLLKENRLFPEIIIDKKCDKSAVRSREDGNMKFKKKKLREAVDFYTESLAYAEKSSDNFSKALANRSAALFEMELYEECVTDINRAIENHYPEDLTPKLLRRKENALNHKSPSSITTYFNSISKIPISLKSNDIECASNSIQIKYSETHGRHIVTTRNINIGEIIAVEKPFCHILATNYFSHCHDCLKLCYNLIPCINCTNVFYCDEKCSTNAYKYHKYECNILKTLRTLELDKMKLLPLKIALLVKDLYSTIAQNIQINNDSYKSDRYLEIHNLIGNTNNRTVADLFERSTIAAIIFDIIKNHTSFFCSKQDEMVFKDLILLHFQTAPCNFHEISELAKSENDYYETDEIGAGAFAFLSLFNHSCNPNVVRHCHGNVIVVRAIRSIVKGEQCYDNYGYHFAITPKENRRNNLKKQYFFDCNCDACENNWPLLTDLPYINMDTNVTKEDIISLRLGDRKSANTVLKNLLPKMYELEKTVPNRLFFEMQEVLKQCYALLGNKRKY